MQYLEQQEIDIINRKKAEEEAVEAEDAAQTEEEPKPKKTKTKDK